MASAEDTVLSKLEWYRLGGETSDRQWRDLLNVLKVQGERIDTVYLRHWAAQPCKLRVAAQDADYELRIARCGAMGIAECELLIANCQSLIAD